MHDDFGIAGGLENRAAMLEVAAQFGGIGEIAVVRQGQLAFIAIDDDGLRVDQRGIAGGGVARVADGGRARQARQHLRLEDFLHQAHALFEMQVGAIGRDDAGRFLAAMLQERTDPDRRAWRLRDGRRRQRHRSDRGTDRRRDRS